MSDDSEETTKVVKASLGGLNVRVQGSDLDDVEETFESVWSERLSEADEMSEALRDRMSGYE